MKKIPFTKDDLYRMHYMEDLTTGEIAKEYGCHQSSVRNALKRYGIVPRGKIKKEIPHELSFKLVDMYINQNMSARKIGKILNMSHDTVSKKLKQLGVEVHSKEVVAGTIRHPNWNGGYTLQDGYIRETRSGKGAHVIVMEAYLGRELKRNEIVHHIDGDKQNNKINNLAVMDISAHTRLHALERWERNA